MMSKPPHSAERSGPVGRLDLRVPFGPRVRAVHHLDGLKTRAGQAIRLHAPINRITRTNQRQ